MLQLSREQIHHYLYIACLITIAIAIPLSNYVMSMGGVFLLANAVLQWDWQEKWNRLKENKIALVFPLFYLIYCLGLIHTDNFSAATDALLNRLPIFLAPMIIATSALPTRCEWRVVIHAYLGSVLFATIYSSVYYLTHEVADIREISRFISHIRFSLSVVFSIVLASSFVCQYWKSNKIQTILYLLLIGWLVCYLFVSQTLTGIMILFLLLVVLFLYFLFRWTDKKRKVGVMAALAFPILLFLTYFVGISVDYFKEKDAGAARLPATENGNPYYHDENSMIENGYKIYTYISYDELPSAWGKRSDISYPEVEATLIRYLNSLGLHKDSAGVAQLSDWDVQNIENGIANVEYARKFGLRKNLYATFFSLSAYHHYRQVANSSLLQRVELWRNSWSLIKRNFWLGVGIGDHKQALDEELVKTDSPLKDTRNKGCHNQFLTIWLSSGIFAFLALIVLLFAPFFCTRRHLSLLYLLFFVILFTSMFTEDTLDTNAGVFLFSLFNALLLFVYPKIEKSM